MLSMPSESPPSARTVRWHESSPRHFYLSFDHHNVTYYHAYVGEVWHGDRYREVFFDVGLWSRHHTWHTSSTHPTDGLDHLMMRLVMFLTIETASEPLLLSSMDVCMEAPLLWRYDDESRVYETVSSMPRESLPSARTVRWHESSPRHFT